MNVGDHPNHSEVASSVASVGGPYVLTPGTVTYLPPPETAAERRRYEIYRAAIAMYVHEDGDQNWCIGKAIDILECVERRESEAK